jgi:PleD family two-component response regulator
MAICRSRLRVREGADHRQRGAGSQFRADCRLRQRPKSAWKHGNNHRLTQLPNKALFADRLRLAAVGTHERVASFALFRIGLDRFEETVEVAA